MKYDDLMTRIDQWYEQDEHQKIVDAILALPQKQRDDELLGQLAVAYNNLDDYDAAIAVLEQLRPRQEHSYKWQFRMGYALYYLDRNEQAKVAFHRCMFLDPTQDYREQSRKYLAAIERELCPKSQGDNGEMGGFELYSQEQLDAVDAHITRYFGEYPNVFHEIASPDIHVDICVIAPSEQRDYYTLVTMGMGAHQMNVPSELTQHKLERAELVIALPSDWKLDDGDETWYWPIRLLKQLARLPGQCDTWLGWGHTVDHEHPFADNTQLCGSILMEPLNVEEGADVCPLPGDEEVNFYQVIPIYREEMEYKQANNAETLFDRMEDIPFVVAPDRPNCCQGLEDLGDEVLDSALLHLESLREKQLPVEELAAYNHLAIYLRWCIEQGLMSDLFAARLPKLMQDIQAGRHTLDLREQLRDKEELNHALIRPYFNGDGAAFADYYYQSQGEEDNPFYPADVDEYAKEYFGQARYHSEEFQDEAYLFVPYDEAYYQGMKRYIDRRYKAWTQLQEQLAQHSAPSPLARAMMGYLDCPCRYFQPTLDDDEIVAAYQQAAQRGKQEGFVPVLVAEDDTLWECLIMNSDEDSEDKESFIFDASKVADYRRQMLELPLLQGSEVTSALLHTRQEQAEDDELNWEEEVLGQQGAGECNNRFIGYWNYGTRTTMPLILAEIPVKNPWEIFAFLPFGGWNECPDTAQLMAVSKSWFERCGAVPAVMTHDTLEFTMPVPIKAELAMQMALEHYAWCPDVIDQGGEDATVGSLADSLAKSKYWYFWWD